MFNYDSSHTVDEVSSDDYTTCNVGNSIMSYNSGTTTITLNTTGSHYFICGIVGHCSVGMKLTVDVTGAGGVGSPSAAPSAVTGDSPTATPFGTTLAPPTVAGSTSNIPVESSSPAVSPFAAAIFSLVALMSVLILGWVWMPGFSSHCFYFRISFYCILHCVFYHFDYWLISFQKN